MKELQHEAKRRKIKLFILPTVEAIEELKENADGTNAIPQSRPAHAPLRTRVFESEGTGFLLMAFDDAAAPDSAAREVEAIMPTNRYLVLKRERLFGDESLMNHMLLVAIDDWTINEERFSTAWTPVKTRLRLSLRGSYDMDFYDPHAAATFFTSDYCFQYAFETFLDSGHELSLFDSVPEIGALAEEQGRC